jgi:hypothetical protein
MIVLTTICDSPSNYLQQSWQLSTIVLTTIYDSPNNYLHYRRKFKIYLSLCVLKCSILLGFDPTFREKKRRKTKFWEAWPLFGPFYTKSDNARYKNRHLKPRHRISWLESRNLKRTDTIARYKSQNLRPRNRIGRLKNRNLKRTDTIGWYKNRNLKPILSSYTIGRSNRYRKIDQLDLSPTSGH